MLAYMDQSLVSVPTSPVMLPMRCASVISAHRELCFWREWRLEIMQQGRQACWNPLSCKPTRASSPPDIALMTPFFPAADAMIPPSTTAATQGLSASFVIFRQCPSPCWCSPSSESLFLSWTGCMDGLPVPESQGNSCSVARMEQWKVKPSHPTSKHRCQLEGFPCCE